MDAFILSVSPRYYLYTCRVKLMSLCLDAVDLLFLVNGLYDLICACSILWLYRLPGFNFMSKLHTAMFKSREHWDHPVIRRLIAYWLFTYGMARIAAGMHRDKVLDIVGALTYFIEAFCFEYETRVGETMIRSKVTFVSALSMLLGVFVLSRSIVTHPPIQQPTFSLGCEACSTS